MVLLLFSVNIFIFEGLLSLKCFTFLHFFNFFPLLVHDFNSHCLGFGKLINKAKPSKILLDNITICLVFLVEKRRLIIEFIFFPPIFILE